MLKKYPFNIYNIGILVCSIPVPLEETLVRELLSASRRFRYLHENYLSSDIKPNELLEASQKLQALGGEVLKKVEERVSFPVFRSLAWEVLDDKLILFDYRIRGKKKKVEAVLLLTEVKENEGTGD